jgi:ketosteroid isomerase-like protein
MSEENVEAMRRAIDAFNRGDGESFDGFLADDAEIVPVRAALEGTVYRGADAATQYCAAVDASWENLAWEVEEIREGASCELGPRAGTDSRAGTRKRRGYRREGSVARPLSRWLDDALSHLFRSIGSP